MPITPAFYALVFMHLFSRSRALAGGFAAFLVLAGTCLFHSPATAQSFPSRNVTIVVPFPPGGGADTLARMLAPRLQASWGHTVLIENRPGARKPA